MDAKSVAGYKIALIRWTKESGIGRAIAVELRALGHTVMYFPDTDPVPTTVDVVFLYGPFGKYLHLLERLHALPQPDRPTVVFWNTEGLPDLRLPWTLMRPLGVLRSWVGRYNTSAEHPQDAAHLAPLENRLTRFRYLGDFLYAQRRGLIDVMVDISAVYADFFKQHSIPVGVAPFGSFGEWHANLQLERDIDVVWMGKRGSRRRSKILDHLRAELRQHGVDIHMIDNIEHPFVFDDERTQLLNRTKITLNILRTWYDENSLRFCMAAPNRSLIVSEPLLPHVPQYKDGVHYVSAPINKLAETILYYLKHESERQQIAENAFHLLTTTLTFKASMKIIMQAVRASKRSILSI